ncbi:uncharacterized protein LOC122253096 isoform X2 [Penaeus japonicus]|uniref:uncharacterized protein LOC122253096 isoform X2 n=1 Tax=Penaeus japonicus TaxID=27405 RepID=UPI001C70F4E9|nr:uncharacterized protein LOC122253096 isoform X2 [Penaeus japonicus]
MALMAMVALATALLLQPAASLSHIGAESPPTVQDLAEATSRRLSSLAKSAHRPLPRLGLPVALDPLRSSSTLKYVHEGDLLRLRLVLDNVTLEGFKSMTVQEVSFNLHPDDMYDDLFAGVSRGHQEAAPADAVGGEDHVDDWYDDEPPDEKEPSWDDDLYRYERWEKLAMQDPEAAEGADATRGADRRKGRERKQRPPVTSEGLVRVAFKQVKVRATYQVRGSAGGFFTFREGGDLTLAVPTVFLTSRLNVTLPGFSDSSRRRVMPRHGRVKVLWVHSDVSIASTKLTLEPGAYPPEWVRQQVQTKLEELSSDLSHGHGAVRLLLRRWGKLLKRLVHRTARSLVK